MRWIAWSWPDYTSISYLTVLAWRWCLWTDTGYRLRCKVAINWLWLIDSLGRIIYRLLWVLLLNRRVISRIRTWSYGLSRLARGRWLLYWGLLLWSIIDRARSSCSWWLLWVLLLNRWVISRIRTWGYRLSRWARGRWWLYRSLWLWNNINRARSSCIWWLLWVLLLNRCVIGRIRTWDYRWWLLCSLLPRTWSFRLSRWARGRWLLYRGLWLWSIINRARSSCSLCRINALLLYRWVYWLTGVGVSWWTTDGSILKYPRS